MNVILALRLEGMTNRKFTDSDAKLLIPDSILKSLVSIINQPLIRGNLV